MTTCSFSWCSRKRETIAQSTKVEYITAAYAVNQFIWLGRCWKTSGVNKYKLQRLCVLTVQAFSVLKNPVFHDRTKHIKVKLHFIRKVQQSKGVLLDHCTSESQLADIFTKLLPKERFEDLKQRIGVCHQNEC